jgi:collagen type VII alpha
MDSLLHRMRANAPFDHVISVQNLAPDGFSGIQFVDDAGFSRFSIGWGNAAAATDASTLTIRSDSGISFSNTEETISVTTGSLQSQGGIGIAKDLHLGGSLHITGSTVFTGSVSVPTPTSESHAATKSYVDNNSNINFTVGDGLVKTDSVLFVAHDQPTITSLGTLTGLTSAGVVNVTNTTPSSSAFTGALRVNGGAGILLNARVGANLNVAGNTTFTGIVTVPTPTASGHATRKSYVDGATYLTAGTGLTRTGATFSVNANQSQIISLGTLTALNCSGIVTFTDTTQSTSATTGAVRIHGGVGIQKNLFVGESITASNLGALAFKDVVDWRTDITDRPLNLTDQVGVVPPAGMTDVTTEINMEGDASFLSGTYVASASSLASATRLPWRAFNRVTSTSTDSWLSSGGLYNSSGEYTGSSSTVSDVGSHMGEWIQIQLPISATVTSFEIYNYDQQFMIKDYTLLGSRNGTTWVHVASGTTPIRAHAWTTQETPSSTSFQFFRLVAQSTHRDTSTSGVRIHDLRFNVLVSFGTLATQDVVDWNTDVINRPTIQVPRNAGTGLTLDTNANTLSVNAVQNQITAVGTLTGLTSSGVVSVTNSTTSTSITTGALRVTGGVGIQGSLFVGNQLNVTGTTTLTGAVTVPAPTANTHATTKGYVDGASYLTAGTGLSRSGGTFSVDAAQSQITSVGTLTGLTSSGAVVISNSTNSTSTSTGALRVTGGAGIQGTLFAGGNVNVAGTTTLTGAVTVPNPTANAHATTKSYVDGATYLTAGTGLTRTGSTFSVNASQSQITTLGTLTSLTSSGIATMTNSTSSTSSTTGAVRITGGVGIQRDLNVGGNIAASNLGSLASKTTSVNWGGDFEETTVALTTEVTPPQPMTGNTSSLTSGTSTALTGTYVASASSATSTSNAAWMAFDHGTTNFWTSFGSYSSGGYDGTVSTIVNGTSYMGEWLQLQSPIAVRLSSFHFRLEQNERFPREYILAGSIDDGVNWNLISSGELPWDVGFRKFELTPSSAYTHVRFIVQSVQSSSTLGRRCLIHDLRYNVEIPSILPPLADVKSVPPIAMSDSSISIDSFHVMWNGTYTASASSSATLNPAWNAFSNNTNGTWSTSGYSTANGSYVSSVTTLADDGKSYSGEWLQLEIPSLIQGRLLSFAFFHRNIINMPREYTLMGSNNGTTWQVIRHGELEMTPNHQWRTHWARFPLMFRFFRFITRRTWGSSVVAIGGLTYNITSTHDIY